MTRAPQTRGVLLFELLSARLLVEVALRRYALDEALRRLTPREIRQEAITSEIDLLDTLAAHVLRNRAHPRNTCLQRALSRYVLFRRRGVDVDFVMGVRPGEGPVTGHAWLELRGEVFREREAVDCIRTFRYPSSL